MEKFCTKRKKYVGLKEVAGQPSCPWGIDEECIFARCKYSAPAVLRKSFLGVGDSDFEFPIDYLSESKKK